MLRWWDGITRGLLAAAGVVLLPVLWVPHFLDAMTIPALLIWDVLALAFLSRQLWIMRCGRAAPDTEESPAWLLSARWIQLRFGALLVASAAGLSSGLLIVQVNPDDAGLYWDLWIIRSLAAITVILAWLILHLGYAMHYASIYFATGHGVRFPGTGTPNFLDFAYFAFTIGATFATSDAEITSRRLRHAVIWHSVLSFFYNAAVLGIAIGAFTGK
ncbi:DUF1345 domain-containing protein [Kribbella yunnanensis]|uniref:DUF1345 domain-containing protein n=1 Tax=Kribbella yunnanensis TaxID=190194 RepID=A0ABN2J8F3_9ACTN